MNGDILEIVYQNAYIGSILYCRYKYLLYYNLEKEKHILLQILYLHYQLLEIQLQI